VQCIRSGATPRSDGKSGLRVVRVLEQLQRSLESASGPRFESNSGPRFESASRSHVESNSGPRGE
jgi:hypothetical protein